MFSVYFSACALVYNCRFVHSVADVHPSGWKPHIYRPSAQAWVRLAGILKLFLLYYFLHLSPIFSPFLFWRLPFSWFSVLFAYYFWTKSEFPNMNTRICISSLLFLLVALCCFTLLKALPQSCLPNCRCYSVEHYLDCEDANLHGIWSGMGRSEIHSSTVIFQNAKGLPVAFSTVPFWAE